MLVHTGYLGLIGETLHRETIADSVNQGDIMNPLFAVHAKGFW
uniref:Uncharacterized protein n=1 Tax=Anguilla anguilla TaxID=7936 RepID=A0A0E9V681_ANGAN